MLIRNLTKGKKLDLLCSRLNDVDIFSPDRLLDFHDCFAVGFVVHGAPSQTDVQVPEETNSLVDLWGYLISYIIN